MGETPINSKALEDAMFKALSSLSPNLLGTTNNPRNEFYDKFKREADEHDRDFIKKYDEDLNTTLIFAGLFSAVTSAFIIYVQAKLEPDYQEFSYKLLKISTSIALGNIPTGDDAKFPEWNGPDSTIVNVQSILYSSLATSLLAASAAMVGKQWLNRYAQVEMHGSVIDRCRHRQRKMNGMITWHFDLVMECLPLMLQAALLLLSYALSNYLYTLSRIVASVTIGFAAFGLLFYLLIASAATLSYNCPFQTPLSLVLRFLIRFDNEHKKYLKRSRKWFGHIFSKKQWWPRANFGGCYGLGGFSASGGGGSGDHIELTMVGPFNKPSPLSDEAADWDGYALDSKCIVWMFEKSMDADVIMAIMRFIPEVVWHTDIQTTPLEKLYDTVLECFDCSTERLLVIPKLRNKAYLSAKALLHLAIQRKCVGNKSDEGVFQSISKRHSIMGSDDYKGDSDLESTLGIIDCVFGSSAPMSWQNFSFTPPHHAWMARILLYRAWDILGKGQRLPNDVKKFVLHSLRFEPLPPAQIVADCISTIGLILGIEPHTVDPSAANKSKKLSLQVSNIYKKLAIRFRNPTPSPGEVEGALEVMELIAPLSGEEIAQESYRLFRILMQAPASLSSQKKWEASRLAMRGAYKGVEFFPWVEDPRDILTFLDHHFELNTRDDKNQDEPIQDALCALAYASSPVTIETLSRFNPTESSFVHGICRVFQDDKPLQLRTAALLFLPLIGEGWFNTPHPIMEPDEMKRLCVDWASVVDSVEHPRGVRKAILEVLFWMIDSPHWRPHIVTEKWRLLEYYTSVPDDSQSFKRCINNPELIEMIKSVGNPVAMGLWLEILWLRYGKLPPPVREKLETITREVARGRRTDLNRCLKVLDSELEKAEKSLIQYHTWSQDPTAVALRSEIDNLQRAKNSLSALKRG